MESRHKKEKQIEDGGTEEARDRISDLPEAILFIILSFLSTKDAVTTGFLSKRWRHFWTSILVLDFDQDCFVDYRRNSLFNDPDFLQNTRKTFADFVDQSLQFHSGQNIQSFRLCFNYYDDPIFNSRVDKWVVYGMRSKAESLELDFCGGGEYRSPLEKQYSLPLCNFITESLKTLKLRFCQFSVRNKSFPFLKSLFLSQLKLQNESLNDLLCNCPCLERLHLMRCWLWHNFILYALKSLLNSLVLNMCYNEFGLIESYDINVSSLLHFKFVGAIGDSFSVNNLSDVTDAEVRVYQNWVSNNHPHILWHFLKSLDRANSLTLSSWCLQVLLAGDRTLERLHSPLYGLKHLKLQTGLGKKELLGIACFLRSCPNLTSLSICIGSSEFIHQFYLDEPRFQNVLELLPFHYIQYLEKVEIINFGGHDNEIALVKFLLDRSVVLREMVICPLQSGFCLPLCERFPLSQKHPTGCQKLLALPRASPFAQVLFSSNKVGSSSTESSW